MSRLGRPPATAIAIFVMATNTRNRPNVATPNRRARRKFRPNCRTEPTSLTAAVWRRDAATNSFRVVVTPTGRALAARGSCERRRREANPPDGDGGGGARTGDRRPCTDGGSIAETFRRRRDPRKNGLHLGPNVGLLVCGGGGRGQRRPAQGRALQIADDVVGELELELAGELCHCGDRVLHQVLVPEEVPGSDGLPEPENLLGMLLPAPRADLGQLPVEHTPPSGGRGIRPVRDGRPGGPDVLGQHRLPEPLQFRPPADHAGDVRPRVPRQEDERSVPKHLLNEVEPETVRYRLVQITHPGLSDESLEPVAWTCGGLPECADRVEEALDLQAPPHVELVRRDEV